MRSQIDATSQIDSVERECLDVLYQAYQFCPFDDAGHRPAIYRLMAVPMIYSAWERAFRVSTAVAIRYLVESAQSVAHLSANQQALLLQREVFFQSYTAKPTNHQGSRGPKKGNFDNLAEFLTQHARWSRSTANLVTDAEEYVMTFSNVDHAVLRLHERILGTGPTTEKGIGSPIDLSLLGELLGRRNAISHGGSLQPPGERELDQLFKFTRTLLASYCDSMRKVIENHVSTHATRISLRGYRLKQFQKSNLPKNSKQRFNLNCQ